jgi:transmembrane sensor
MDGDAADAREHDAYLLGQDALEAQAATWVARRRNGLDPLGEARLQAWLRADPRHAAALESMEQTFSSVKALPRDEVKALKAGFAPQPESLSGQRAKQQPAMEPAARWRSWLPRGWDLRRLAPRMAIAGSCALVVAASLLGWEHWRQQPTFDQSYATARGQQLTVSLPDADAALAVKGSRLQLDTATRLDARLYRNRRVVQLTDGQAMFSVSSDPSKPFHVLAGALRITVVGTRFSVRHTAAGLNAGKTVVAVQEGRVRVSRLEPQATQGRRTAADAPAPHGSAIELTAGQTITADDDGTIGPVATVTPQSIAAWRDGRISFDQTPLAQAIAEFERYGRTGLVALDPEVAAMRVGGSYGLRQFQRFAETLPQVLPVRLVAKGDVTEVVSAR